MNVIPILIIIFLIVVIIFLTVSLRRATRINEFDGDMIVENHENGTLATLALRTDPEDLIHKDQVTFKVVQKEESHI